MVLKCRSKLNHLVIHYLRWKWLRSGRLEQLEKVKCIHKTVQ